MFTVAVIGPDGSGKTAVASRLAEALPGRAKYIYMGASWESSNHLLPTTRLIDWTMRALRPRPSGNAHGADDPSDSHGSPGRARRLYRATRSRLSLANLIAEEWYRQMIAWTYVRRGVTVIFDRHFYFDYYYGHVVGEPERSLGVRVHGLLLSHVYPKPDLVVYLDAPPEVVFARKGEGTIGSLEQRRKEYLAHSSTAENFVVVDARRPVEQVTEDVVAAIRTFAESR